MFHLRVLPTRDMVRTYAEAVGTGDPDVILTGLNGLRRASLLIREIERHFSSYGLSQLKFLVLVVTDRETPEHGLRHKDVAARIDVSKPVLSRVIRALIRDGLLEEGPDAADGRVLRLKLSPAGRAKLYAVFPGYFDIIGSEYGALPPN